MKHFIILTALALMTGSAAMANTHTIIQPHCNEGSACRAALEENATAPGVAPGYGAFWIGTGRRLDGVVQVGSPAFMPWNPGYNLNPLLRQPEVVENDCSLSVFPYFGGHPISITKNYPDIRMRDMSSGDAGTALIIGDNPPDLWPIHRPDRFDFVTDANDVIINVYCG